MHGLTSDVIAGTPVWTAGSGPTLVIVHGGPGFDHTYLVEPLLPLAAEFRLVFYDQPGSAEGRQLTPALLVDQLRELLAALGSNAAPAVLAHSWGTCPALGCFAGAAPRVRALILVSPVALTRERFNRSQARQWKRFPAQLRARLAGSSGLDLQTLSELTPYYLARVNRGRVDVRIPHYDAAAGQQLLAALGDFDFRPLCGSLPARTHLIYGQDEAYRPSDTAEIHACAAVTTLPRAGHFSFAEQPHAFRALVAAARAAA
jgi:pimeloyl-ACP methyl ester carboxylesterase